MPSVSLIMIVRNGMPLVRDAIASVAAQTCDDFELVVQDGASTDGTSDFLRGVKHIADYKLVTEPDKGVGDAAKRAFARATGRYLGFIDADNLLDPDAVRHAIEHFRAHPGCAALYGGNRLLDAGGNEVAVHRSGPFQLLRLLLGELVPPFATAYFNRAACGDALVSDDSIPTCSDFDLWLRLSHLRIDETPHVLASTRLTPMSGTLKPELYDRFLRDKLRATRRYFEGVPASPLRENVMRQSEAGLHLWAAESLLDLEGPSEQCEKYLCHAESLDPLARRCVSLRRRFDKYKLNAVR